MGEAKTHIRVSYHKRDSAEAGRDVLNLSVNEGHEVENIRQQQSFASQGKKSRALPMQNDKDPLMEAGTVEE